MPDNPNVVALLKEYRDEVSLTRTEAGRIIGKTRNQVAGLCNRNYIKPWLRPLPHVLKNRGCQFPINQPGTTDFRLCGMFRTNDPLVCAEHKGKVWKPESKVFRMKK
jgi:hypothetical protein